MHVGEAGHEDFASEVDDVHIFFDAQPLRGADFLDASFGADDDAVVCHRFHFGGSVENRCVQYRVCLSHGFSFAAQCSLWACQSRTPLAALLYNP